MKNVAIIIPSLKKGGAEKQAAVLARALNGFHNVFLIVVNPRSGYEKELIDLCGLDSERIIPLWSDNKKTQIYRFLREHSIEVLFCYLTWPDFFGVILGRLAGVKQIYQGLRNASLPRYKLMLEKIGNLFSTGSVCNNYAGEVVFRKNGIKNIIVIPNCYDNPQAYRKREERNTVKIITVGRFVEQKDYPVAIKAVALAMKRDGRLEFEIIGHGVLEEEIRNLIKEHGIDDRTKIFVNPPNILDHLKKADVYLSTSLFEGTSNSIMEALDASLPVVATDVGDNARLVIDGKNGFVVKPKDVDAICESLLRLSDSYDLRIEMGIKSNELLKEEYGFETFRDRYLNLINQH